MLAPVLIRSGACLLATFLRAAGAVRWALGVMDKALYADWPEALLQNGMCEEARGHSLTTCELTLPPAAPAPCFQMVSASLLNERLALPPGVAVREREQPHGRGPK